MTNANDNRIMIITLMAFIQQRLKTNDINGNDNYNNNSGNFDNVVSYN